MHKNELIFQKINNPELIKVAKTLKNEGVVLQDKNYTYLKTSDDFIHKLYPLIAEHEYLQKPDYFSEQCDIGVHITITYPNEQTVINDQDINVIHSFEIEELAKTQIENKQKDFSFKSQTIEIIKFMSQFYSGDLNWYIKVKALLNYFADIEGLEKFLSTVDYSSAETIEHSIFPISTINFIKLDKQEKAIWHNINKEYGSEGIKIFSKAVDIKNKNISVTDLYDQNGQDLAKTFKELQEIVKGFKFKDEEQYPEIADLCRKNNATEENFRKIIEEILPKFKTKDNLPYLEYKFKIKGQNFTFKKLPTNENIKALFIGKNTKSCEFVGGLGEEAVISAVTNEDTGFYVITDHKDKIIADCYAWRGKNKNNLIVLMLDSFEHLPGAKKLFFPLLEKLAKEKEMNALVIYLGGGGKTPILNSYTTKGITPLNRTIYQHEDSLRSYKIIPG